MTCRSGSRLGRDVEDLVAQGLSAKSDGQLPRTSRRCAERLSEYKKAMPRREFNEKVRQLREQLAMVTSILKGPSRMIYDDESSDTSSDTSSDSEEDEERPLTVRTVRTLPDCVEKSDSEDVGLLPDSVEGPDIEDVRLPPDSEEDAMLERRPLNGVEGPDSEDVQPQHVETPRPLQTLCVETLVREVAEKSPETFEKVGLAVQTKEESEFYLGQDQSMMWSTRLVDKRLDDMYLEDPRVPWYYFGDVDFGRLGDLGLKEQDFCSASQWVDGFSNIGEAVMDPKMTLRAADVFKRSSEDGRVCVKEDSVFVKELRERYCGQVAERILRYLEHQYEEWLSCAKSHGCAWRKAARKMADGQCRELRLHEKLELLFWLEASAP